MGCRAGRELDLYWRLVEGELLFAQFLLVYAEGFGGITMFLADELALFYVGFAANGVVQKLVVKADVCRVAGYCGVDAAWQFGPVDGGEAHGTWLAGGEDYTVV